MHTNIHAYIHTYIHTYIQTYIHTYIQTYIQTYIHRQKIRLFRLFLQTLLAILPLHTYIQTYVHTSIHTNIHTNIHTHTHTRSCRPSFSSLFDVRLRKKSFSWDIFWATDWKGHFACQDSALSRIFKLIFSASEKILTLQIDCPWLKNVARSGSLIARLAAATSFPSPGAPGEGNKTERPWERSYSRWRAVRVKRVFPNVSKARRNFIKEQY